MSLLHTCYFFFFLSIKQERNPLKHNPDIIFYREKTTGCKTLQLVSGVPHIVYWLSHFIWDYMRYCILTVAIIVTIAIWGAAQGGDTAFTHEYNEVYVKYWNKHNL